MTMGDVPKCVWCGQYSYNTNMHGKWLCGGTVVLNDIFQPRQFTEFDIRRIVLEELERAKEKP